MKIELENAFGSKMIDSGLSAGFSVVTKEISEKGERIYMLECDVRVLKKELIVHKICIDNLHELVQRLLDKTKKLQ